MLLRVESLTRLVGVAARGRIDISQQDRWRHYSMMLRAVALRNNSDGLDVLSRISSLRMACAIKRI